MIAGGSPSRPTSIQQLISAEFCARLDRLDLLSRKIFAGKMQGERRSKQRGQSVEFEDYRNYVPGDDLRHVDWNVFARLDRFFIKIFQHEEDLSCQVVLDTSASMEAGTPPKILTAQRLAMALAYVALVNNNRVGVTVYDGSRLRWTGPVRGRRNLQRVARFLIESAWPHGSPERGSAPEIEVASFAAAMRAVAQSRTGKGVMLVISDFLIPEGYEAGLRLLTGGGYDTTCLQVLSPGELDPTREGARADGVPILIGDLQLIDVETGRIAEVTLTADLINKYKETVRAYIEKLRTFCAARDMGHILVQSDVDVEELVLEQLRQRGLLR